MLHQQCSGQPGSQFQLQLQMPLGLTAAGVQSLAGSLPAKGPHRESMHLNMLQILLPARYFLSSQYMAAIQARGTGQT